MRSKLLLPLIALFGIGLLLGLGGDGARAQAQTGGTLCIVYDIGGRGDLAFNDLAALGGDRAKKELGMGLVEVQSSSEADYLPNLRGLDKGGNCTVITAIGFLLTDAMSQVADEFPNQLFAGIDITVGGKPNVLSVVFRENEGSALVGALAGLIAGKLNTSYKVGVVLGIEIPTLWKFEIGYKWGVKWARAANPNSVALPVDVLYVYTGAFNDPPRGKTATEAQLGQGAVVVYNVAGATGLGIFDAVEAAGTAAGKTQGPPFAIGVDADQDYIKPGFILASMMKRVDNGVFSAAQLAQSGKDSFLAKVKATSGIWELGLKDGGIAVSKLEDLDTFLTLGIAAGRVNPADRDKIFSAVQALRTQYQDQFNIIAQLQQKILDGTCVVPKVTTQDGINQWRPILDPTGAAPDLKTLGCTQ
jgi:basic membrane protein A